MDLIPQILRKVELWSNIWSKFLRSPLLDLSFGDRGNFFANFKGEKQFSKRNLYITVNDEKLNESATKAGT